MDSSFSSSTINDSDTESEDDRVIRHVTPPKRRKYRRALHHGVNIKGAHYFNVTPEKYGALSSVSATRTSENSPLESDIDNTVPVNTAITDWTSSSSVSDSCSEDNSSISSEGFSDSEDSHLNMNCGINSPTIHKDSSEEHVYTLIMLYAMKHSLSNAAFSDLLQLISAILPISSAAFTTSVYKLKEKLKLTAEVKDPVIHHFCDICQQSLGNSHRCAKESCIQSNAKVKDFMELRLEDHLRNLFKDSTFFNLIVNKVAYKSSEKDNKLHDIVDGLVHKKWEAKSDRNESEICMSFSLNTDGVSLFSSSKKGCLWPVYVAINELPVTLRFSRKYLLPCLLFCHPEKPNMQTYLAPIIKVFQKLQDEGLLVQTPKGPMTVKGTLLAASLDLPARALVANMKQFNGKYPCTVCLHEGETAAGNPLHRYFPYRENNERRTHNSFLVDAEKAAETRQAVHGIKGASPLMALAEVDMTSIFPVDWMHCVLLGVTKSLMSLWFDKKTAPKISL